MWSYTIYLYFRLPLYGFSKYSDIPYHYALSPSFYTAWLEVTIISLLSFSGFPSVTSLRYDYQSRTFTCTSTGGPATTVTWKRNEIVISLNTTHQQTKSLVDFVASTYQKGRSRVAVIIDILKVATACIQDQLTNNSHP